MDNQKTIEVQSAAPADVAATAISASAVGARSANPVIDIAKLDPPKVAALDAELSTISPGIEPPKLAAGTPAPSNRFALLAGAVALAAAFGAVAGALGASGLARPVAASVGADVATTVPESIYGLQTTVEQLRSELAALRTGVEAGTRSSNAQFGKITERFDRVERAQADRAAKLAKATETLERLERRADVVPAKETTGSIAAPPVAAPASPTSPPQPPAVSGWTVREVYRGIALIQNGRSRMMEVEAGDTVPYLGRIESIRRQDGRWQVVTSRGVITSVR